MKTFFIYFLLLAFYLENSLHFQLTQITGLSLMNLSIYMLFIFWMLSMVTNRKIVESNPIYKYLALVVFVVVFSIPLKVVCGNFRDVIIMDEVMILKEWITPFVLFFVLFNIIKDETTCRHVIWGLMVFLAVTVLTTQLVSLGVVAPATDKVFQNGRAAGFVEPNQYASYLVLFIPLIIIYVINRKTLITRMIASVLFVMVLVDLVSTGSRGGFVSFLFSMGVFFFVLYQKKMVRFIVLKIIIASALFFGAAAFVVTQSGTQETLIDRLDMSESSDMDDYTSGRISILVNGIKLFMENPILGYGQETFGTMMEKRFGISFNSHNDYLLYLVQYGIFGFGLFILLYMKIFYHLWYNLNHTTDVRRMALYSSYLAGFVGYAVSMLSVNLFNPRILFWIYTAVVFKYIQLDSTEAIDPYLQEELSYSMEQSEDTDPCSQTELNYNTVQPE